VVVVVLVVSSVESRRNLSGGLEGLNGSSGSAGVEGGGDIDGSPNNVSHSLPDNITLVQRSSGSSNTSNGEQSTSESNGLHKGGHFFQ